MSLAVQQRPLSDQLPLEYPTRDWINENGKRVRTPQSDQAPTAGPMSVFRADASVALVGIRGVGKSTLAIIASTAMKRRIVDAEKAFQQSTGFTSTRYKKLYGPAECHSRQAETLADILAQHPKNTIIVCSWIERGIQSLLRAFAAKNPVIHVVRDARAIAEHLKLQDVTKARSLLNVSSEVFRGCSNYEFFNLSEKPSANEGVLTPRSPAPYLTLKRAERHFLKFLSLVMPPGSIPFIDSAFPLASIPAERRKFTYAVSLKLSEVLREDTDIDIESVETGADAIEIIIDDLPGPRTDSNRLESLKLESARATSISRAISLIRRSTVIPIICHVAAPSNLCALEPGNHRNYLEHVEHCLRLSPEYVTANLGLEDDQLSEVLMTRRRSRVIAHREFVNTPNNGHTAAESTEAPPWSHPTWLHTYRRAQALGFDLVRFIRPCAEIDENFEVQRLRLAVSSLRGPQLPLIAFNSGMMGRQSACFNQTLTSVVPDGATLAERLGGSQGGSLDGKPSDEQRLDQTGTVDNQSSLSALQATKALYAAFVYDPMELYVFGANVSYSLSPAMHNTALRACGIPHHYRAISTDSLDEIRAFVNRSNFAGASVGLPFKVEIISITHALSEHARAIGAVNTLIPIRRPLPAPAGDGKLSTGIKIDAETLFSCTNRNGPVRALYGENTDWIGIRACIRRGLSPANAVRPTSCGVVIGAGGMARAAVYAMLQIGVENIVVYNRTRANAEKLVAHFNDLLNSRPDLPPLFRPMPSGPLAGADHIRSSGTTTPVELTVDEVARGSHAATRFHVMGSLDDPWPETFRLPTMIVSCIPTHSIGDVASPNFTLPPAWLGSPTGGVVVELAYKTLDTPLLEQTRREAHRGWVTMDGLDLLPEQGFAQFELFTGRRAPRRLMRRQVLSEYPTDETNRTAVEQLRPRLRNIVEQEP